MKIDLKTLWTDQRKVNSFFVANACLIACGLASLVVGIWLYCTKNNFVELTPTAYSALSAAGLCVFTGVTIFIITAVGYLGVTWNNKPLFVSYVSFIVLLIIVHGVARTTGFLHKDEARENLRKSLLRNINTTTVITKIGREIKLQLTWDHLQRELECCGVDTYTDWYYSVHWPINQYTPDSCCNPEHFDEGADNENCGKMPDDKVVFQDGCFPKFADWLYHHIILVNWVTSILFIVEIILFVVSCFVMGVLKRASTPHKTRRRSRREHDDETSERFRLNSMDRIADANAEPATVEDGLSTTSH
ncbi:unnamed protein product [Caenorhabditis sp. 36 PRJEB53466]|nr:unnamed protein product [Caenorhabditis sp. 36 PRJEB53466]